jgi:hypothetical protein
MENKAVVKLLEKAGEQMVDKMIDTLIKNKSVATGKLGRSLKPEVTYSNGVYSLEIDGELYGKFVDQGRKPGSYAPVNAITQWIKVKRIRPQKGVTVESLSYLINRKIKDKGIPARPFIKPSVQFILNRLEDQLKDLGVAAVQEDVDAMIMRLQANAK